MKFGFAALLLSAFTAVSAVDLRYDNTYDAKGGSLNTVACSDGKNGLITRFGFKTFGDIPTFPNIGAAQAVASWNSTSCGSCWQITYPNTGISIFVTAIDHAGSGFNVAQAAMDKLTRNNAVQLGRVDVTARQVAASNCKL